MGIYLSFYNCGDLETSFFKSSRVAGHSLKLCSRIKRAATVLGTQTFLFAFDTERERNLQGTGRSNPSSFNFIAGTSACFNSANNFSKLGLSRNMFRRFSHASTISLET